MSHPMPDIASNVRRLSEAAWALREAAPPSGLALPPFALALFTDDRRQGDLLSLLGALPGADEIPPVALIFRHDGLAPGAREALARAALTEIQDRGHLFLMARGELQGADGSHACSGEGIVSWPVHSAEEALTAEAAGAGLAFLSPVFATESHPGAAALGRSGLAALIEKTPLPAFALGGVTAANADILNGLPLYGIGAIGAWSC